MESRSCFSVWVLFSKVIQLDLGSGGQESEFKQQIQRHHFNVKIIFSLKKKNMAKEAQVTVK